MPASIRLSLDADAPEKLRISINRTDIAPGEPGSLLQYVDLAPGEIVRLPVYTGCSFYIVKCW